MEIGSLIETTSVVLGIIVYVWNRWKDKRRLNGVKKSKSLDVTMEINAEIYPVLWELLSTFSAMRVYIVQFHNGSNFYTGQSIQRMTISHEVVRNSRSVRKLNPFYDNVLLSSMDHEMLMDMKKGGYFVCTDRSAIKQDEIADWLELYGVSSAYHFLINDKNTGEIVATLNIHWDRTDPILPIDVIDIQETKKRIESIFDKL